MLAGRTIKINLRNHNALGPGLPRVRADRGGARLLERFRLCRIRGTRVESGITCRAWSRCGRRAVQAGSTCFDDVAAY